MRKSLGAILISVPLFLPSSIFATKYVFIGKGAWSDAANWQNKLMPPANLKKGDTIMINGSAVTTSACCKNDFESNMGTVIISQGASLTLQNATQFSNYGGSFIISGTLLNNTNFEVYNASSIIVTGTIVNQLWMGNQGAFTLNGGTITNKAVLDNDMGVKKGQLTVNCGSTFNNTSSGKLVMGSLILNCGTQIINSGSVSGTPTIGN